MDEGSLEGSSEGTFCSREILKDPLLQGLQPPRATLQKIIVPRLHNSRCNEHLGRVATNESPHKSATSLPFVRSGLLYFLYGASCRTIFLL
ncbi:Hypothetical protein NTJ_14116 [Nesidiocoris tenuis]|uniref:Uncharacterized protein n=1 Tax=Nesidiocoris tenuis TaxID=355587 RepID=A0ABN7BBT4_9HEMI|nr:Hypothetical protein NTJ_14116 [Nesidiocoris tenuis]